MSPIKQHSSGFARFKRFFLRFSLVIFILYASGCLLVYFNQEKLLFHPEKLAKTHSFSFETAFREFDLTTPDGESLNGLLFSGDSSHRRLIFYLHGNTGSLQDQEGPSAFYTSLGYDICCFDYRGFGKSSGSNTNQDQLVDDVRLVYKHLKKQYKESEIVIIGYSLGTGPATILASENNPKQLILLAPYYSVKELAAERHLYIPSFLVAYPFETFRYIQQVKCPISIFHGKQDKAIPFSSSKRLAGLLKKDDLFVPLENCDHNEIGKHAVFTKSITQMLK
ncbi:MAG: alpha/beta fold hydrolase [Fluviicola sp.]|nr:alpha/beta fold hydrolase [Fluviicola sp.]